MSQDAPKLYINKPKKGKRKVASVPGQTVVPSGSSYSPSAAATSYLKGPPPAPPPRPPPPPLQSFVRRNKFLWPLLLGVNLVVGGYYFLRTKNTVEGPTKNTTLDASPSTIASPIADKPSPVQSVKIRDPIPEAQQRELFKWILDEKRKIKPNDEEEKRCLDKEKTILKQFIRAKSLPPEI